jgi:hypothetical protein
MNKNWLLIGGIALLLVAVALIVNSALTSPPTAPVPEHQAHASVEPAAQSINTMPAHYEYAPSRASLGPTLEPEKFTGATRDAYRAAREIPETLAQLPCYCHCDRGMGHKSLYSCYQDEHASHCATCVNEALLALKLEKEQKLPAAQIRDRIVQQFGQ